MLSRTPETADESACIVAVGSSRFSCSSSRVVVALPIPRRRAARARGSRRVRRRRAHRGRSRPRPTPRTCLPRSSIPPTRPALAGDWYRGSAIRSIGGTDFDFEVFVRASTPAQARARCPQIAGPAAYFLHGYAYSVSLLGRVDVRTGNAVTFKDAGFAAIRCARVQTAADPVPATVPRDATAANARLASFLDDYLRGNDWFVAALHHVGPNGAENITVTISGTAADVTSRCAYAPAVRRPVSRPLPDADRRGPGERPRGDVLADCA